MPATTAGFWRKANSPILNKIGRVLSSPALRNIIAQPRSTIDLRKMMDEGRILIVNLAKGALGEGTAHLLGAFITTGLAQAALSRADTPETERRVFHLYADEFQSFATESFALILSEARKYGLTLTLGHQYLGQLSDQLRQAVLGNTGSFIAFRVGAEDAELVAHHLGLGSVPGRSRPLQLSGVWPVPHRQFAEQPDPARPLSPTGAEPSPPSRTADRQQSHPLRPRSPRG